GQRRPARVSVPDRWALGGGVVAAAGGRARSRGDARLRRRGSRCARRQSRGAARSVPLGRRIDASGSAANNTTVRGRVGHRGRTRDGGSADLRRRRLHWSAASGGGGTGPGGLRLLG